MPIIYCPHCCTETEMITINEARIFIGRCRRTIYNWIDAGAVHVVATPGGRALICKASLVRSRVGRYPPRPLKLLFCFNMQ